MTVELKEDRPLCVLKKKLIGNSMGAIQHISGANKLSIAGCTAQLAAQPAKGMVGIAVHGSQGQPVLYGNGSNPESEGLISHGQEIKA
jgi:hypothetical protein